MRVGRNGWSIIGNDLRVLLRGLLQTKRLSCIVALLIMLLAVSPTSARTPTEALHVDVFPAAPFVIEENGTLTGFSIDLWDAIATRLKI